MQITKSIETAVKSGILVINKPTRCTSFQVVREVRRILEIEKVGHCGTLDPMASGVMVILFGSATSFSEELMNHDKVYRAGMLLGIKTDTGDGTGKILHTASVPAFSRGEIENTLSKFSGEIDQIPPMFSAIKWKGRKLYEYARKGIEVERNPRKIFIHSITLLEHEKSYIQFRMACSKGTYVRSLVEDIGEVLRVPATLTDLIREKSGSFSIRESISWDDLNRMSRDELLSKSIPTPP